MTVEEIFAAAAVLPAEEWAAYLDSACAGRPELRARVEALLRSHDASGFMEGSSMATEFSNRTPEGLPAYSGEPGAVIGRYRLLKQIGEGGFGVVWMAEQLEPVTRRVALKIIKPGMDTHEVIARFEAERQALAMMDHPNIAKVLDAGATDNGRPFFVMELVKGIPITAFCDDHEFTTRRRLELFADVCSAINHAHQKGVIHRDLKPSNVLVSIHGENPVPQVIDFGIAKATEGRLTDKTHFTGVQQFLGTPAYMSPEQAAISERDLDTRSDIYGLGILLYELLTGKPPFDTHMLLSGGCEEMRRIICEVEPPRPSSCLRGVLGEQRIRLAKSRSIAPEKLSRSVEPDIDWIVMKAVEKDRTRRYATANALALDIERFLTDEPVSATPPTTAYRLRKFARRNKTGLRSAAAVAIALTTAALLSTWHAAGIAGILIAAATASTGLAVRAVRAERQANRRTADERKARDDAEAVSAFYSEILRSPDPSLDGRGITVAELLDRIGVKLDAVPPVHPGRHAALHGVLGRTYRALGLPKEAIPWLERGSSLTNSAFGSTHGNSVCSMRDLALSYQAAGRSADALALQEEVLKRNRDLRGAEHPETLESMAQLAESCFLSDRPSRALQLRTTLLAQLRRAQGPEHPMTISATHRFAESCLGFGERLEEALNLERSTLALSRRILGPEHPDTLLGMHILGHCLTETGAHAEAIAIREEEISLRRKAQGADHSATLHCRLDLARSHFNAGRMEEALDLQDETLLRSRRVFGSGHPHTVLAVFESALLLVSAGRREQGRHLLGELASRPVAPIPVLLGIAALQAWLCLDSGHLAICRRLLQREISAGEPAPAAHAATACCLHPLNDSKLIGEARVLALRAVNEGRKTPELPWYHLSLGMAEFRHGDVVAADRALTAAERGAPRLSTPRERARLGSTSGFFRSMCLLRQDRVGEARSILTTSETQMKPLPVDGLPCREAIAGDDLIPWLACTEARTALRQIGPRTSNRGRGRKHPHRRRA